MLTYLIHSHVQKGGGIVRQGKVIEDWKKEAKVNEDVSYCVDQSLQISHAGMKF